jgi:hypothetical protein
VVAPLRVAEPERLAALFAVEPVFAAAERVPAAPLRVPAALRVPVVLRVPAALRVPVVLRAPVAPRPAAALLLPAAARPVPLFAVVVRDFEAPEVPALLEPAFAPPRLVVPALLAPVRLVPVRDDALRVLPPVAPLRPAADFAAPRVVVAPFVALIVFGFVVEAFVDFLAAGAPAAFEVFVVAAMMLSRDL